VGLLGRGISPSQSRYLHTEHHKHKINAHNIDIHALSGIRTHDPSVSSGEDSSCLRPRGQCLVSRAPKRWAPLCCREETFILATMLQEDVCMWIYWTQTDSTSYKLVCRLNQSTVRISMFSSKSRLTRRRPSTGFAKDVPPFGVQHQVYKDPHTKKTAYSLLCVSSHVLNTLLQIPS
jgi:hypothetical protein